MEGMPGSLPLDADYARYADSVHVWASPEEFGRGRWPAGVHVVWITPEVHVDVLLGEGLEGVPVERAIPVFFGGAISTRDGVPGPYFSGAGLAREVGTPFVAIADPTLNHDHSLKIAWYTGRVGDGAQTAVARILRQLALRYQRHLLFVGGSGGGFTSLFHAGRATFDVSAFVWNAQTDTLRYSAGPVVEHLSVALGRTSAEVHALDEPTRSALLREGGIEHRIHGATIHTNPSVRRLLYLQNASDWHVPVHTAPFLGNSGFQTRGEGRWESGGDRVVLFSDARPAHDPPARSLLTRVLRSMLDESTPIRFVIADLESSGELPADGRGNLPDDLRRVAPTVLPRVRMVARPADGGGAAASVVSLGDDLTPGGITGILARVEDDQAVVDVADGFGNRLGSITGPVVAIDPVRVFVMGSCVARDTFGYLDPRVFRLNDYVARTSLASIFSAGGEPPVDPELLTSAFQRRMLEIDAASSMPALLEELAPTTDLLLWDLTDERLGLLQHPDGRLTTDSVDVRAVGGQHLDPMGRIPLGSDQHVELFAEGLERWGGLLTQVGLLRRTVLIAPPWADHTLPPGEPPLSFGVDAARGNELFAPYVALARERWEFPILGAGLSDPASPVDHRWGPAPFHYDEHTYVRLAREIVGAAVRTGALSLDPRVDPDTLVRRRPRHAPVRKARRKRAPRVGPPAAVARVVPGGIEVTVTGERSASFKVDLYRDRDRVATGGWSREAIRTFPVDTAGAYRARVHVRTPGGDPTTLTTNIVHVAP